MEQEQWTEIEDDAKKLHDLIESQRDKINVLASLISETGWNEDTLNQSSNIFVLEPTPPVAEPRPNVVSTPKVVPLFKPEEVTLATNAKKTSNTPSITSLLKKITDMSQSISQNRPTTNSITSDTTLINHSPGVSPTQSMNTLVLSTLTSTIVDQDEEPFDQPQTTVEETKPTNDEPHKPIDIPLPQPEPSTVNKANNPTPLPPPQPEPYTVKKTDNPKPSPPQPSPVKKEDNAKPLFPPPRPPQPPVQSESPAAEAKKCPVCHFQFPSTIDDLEMYDHIDRCLFPNTNNTPPKEYECPNCKGKFSGYSDKDYLQHLNDCYNQEF